MTNTERWRQFLAAQREGDMRPMHWEILQRYSREILAVMDAACTAAVAAERAARDKAEAAVALWRGRFDAAIEAWRAGHPAPLPPGQPVPPPRVPPAGYPDYCPAHRVDSAARTPPPGGGERKTEED